MIKVSLSKYLMQYSEKNELNTCIWNKTKSKYFEKYIPGLGHVFREKWMLRD